MCNGHTENEQHYTIADFCGVIFVQCCILYVFLLKIVWYFYGAHIEVLTEFSDNYQRLWTHSKYLGVFGDILLSNTFNFF